MTERPTVFFSHAWLDQSPERVAANPARGLAPVLRDRLVEAGVDVFFDDRDIEDFDTIEKRVRAGMARATVFVSWYSDAYAGRRACHWELTAAVAIDPSRVLVVNPEQSVEHVRPASLRGNLIADVPPVSDAAGWVALVRRIADRAASTAGTFAEIVDADAVPWFGDPPSRFHRFVGRADALWALDGLLRPPAAVAGGEPVPPAVVVYGMGGLGKTALVREYAGRFAAAYPGGIFWLRLTGPDEAAADPESARSAVDAHLALIARQLRLQPTGADGTEPLDAVPDRDAVAARLNSLDRFLWIVDDLPPGLSAADFAFVLPPAGRGRTVITTRGAAYRHVPGLSLDVMGDDEAVELLLAQGPRGEGGREDVRALVARLGHLPLALDVVGALVAMPGTTAGALLAELERPGEELDLLEEAAANPWTALSPTDHASSVVATFAPSIRRLDEVAFILLAVAAAVNAAPLPVRALQPVVQHLVTDGIGPSRVRQGLGTLLALSLVRALDPDTIELHGLVGASVLRYVEDPDAFTDAVVADVSDKIFAELGDVEDIATHPPNRRMAAFGEALALRSSSDDDSFGIRTMRALGRFLHVELRYSEAARVHARALAKAQTEKGGETRASLTLQADLALDVSKTHKDNALRQLEQICDALTRQFGPDDLDTLTVEHNLASALFNVDPERSRQLGLDVYGRRSRAFGPDHPHTLFSLHTLLSQNVVPAPYPDAITAYRDLVARRTSVLGPDHTTTLTSVSNYIEQLVKIGDPATALPLARQLVERRSALYGPGHPATLKARSRLILALSQLSVPPEGEILRELVFFDTVPESAGPRGVVQTLASTGEMLRRAERLDVALAVLTAACRTAAAHLPSDDRDTLLAAHNLAALTAAVDSPQAAKALYDDLVPRMESALGPRHRLTLRGRRQQLIMLAQTGGAAAAQRAQEELAAHWRAQEGERSALHAEALGDLAETSALLGRRDEEKRYRELQLRTGAAEEVRHAGTV